MIGLSDIVQAIKQLAQNTTAIQAALQAVFPQASGSVATSATAGTHGAPPAQVAGYLTITISGTTYKVPLYGP
ncbi:MAG TPA: hypothetical protein VFA22_07200 [Stellaceae bacterium]|nr:hypothetical protein [Stellaceae bacterium]